MTGQQLRNTILQEAIHGRLVPNVIYPGEKTAHELLEDILAIRQKAEIEAKGKKAKKITLCDIDEEPWKLPEGWCWCVLGDISFDSADGPFGSNLKKEHYTLNKEVRIIQLSNIGDKGWKDDNKKYTTFEHLKSISRSEAFSGDIIIAKMMPAGRAIECPNSDKKYVLSSDAVRFSFAESLYKKYICYAINSPVFRDQVYGEVQGITRVRTSLTKLRTYFIPLPPLSIQHAIVSKIEALLPLVEEYDKAQNELKELNESLPERIRKTVLQEAIQGKLVPQFFTKESAKELLSRIYSEKEKFVKSGQVKKKDLVTSPVTEEEKTFDIPEGWAWCRLGDCVTNRAGLGYNKGDLEIKSNDMIRVLRGGNITYGFWKKDANDVMISKEFVKDELLLKRGTFITPAVTSLDNMGKTALIEEDLNDTVVGGFVLMLEAFLKDDIFLKYLLYFFESHYYKEYCKSITNKSGQAFYNLSRPKLMEMPVPIPPIEEQVRIVKKIDEIFSLIK